MENLTVELDKELLYELMLMAHYKDITLNQLINTIMRDYIESLGDSNPAPQS